MASELLFRAWLSQFRRHVRSRRRIFFASTLLAAFNWEKERIEFDQVRSELREFEFVEKLKRKTFCRTCGKKIFIGTARLEGVEYCSCGGTAEQSDEGWEPYIETKGMITWRREERPGLYAYKVYVVYPDVSTEDFLFVQTDVEYRRKWDETAIELRVIDAEPATNSEIIYWEMLWPKLFSNRDYVYNRRYFIDPETDMVIIVNRGTSHPACPPKSNKQRVHQYWSNMVVKPTSEFSKPGLEFVLTYFDDPGLSIPRSITAWVAQRQMPEFLEKLHQATLKYAREKRAKEARRKIWRRDPGFEYPNFENEEIDKGKCDFLLNFLDSRNQISEDDTDTSSTNLPAADPKKEGGGWFSWWFIKKLLLLN